MDGGWRRHWRRAGAGDDAVWAIQATATASPGGVEAGGGGWTEASGGTGGGRVQAMMTVWAIPASNTASDTAWPRVNGIQHCILGMGWMPFTLDPPHLDHPSSALGRSACCRRTRGNAQSGLPSCIPPTMSATGLTRV